VSLIIKITQNGSSQEYLFSKLGPIVIGSDNRSDLHLDDAHVDPKLLEVKMSGGNIFIKELGSRSQMYLNSVILPFREEVRYHEGDCISLKNTNYQIQISKESHEEIDPPPFFENEFKERINRMNLKIQEKESELKALQENQDKKKDQLTELEEKYHRHITEKSKLEAEVGCLRAQKENFSHELRKNAEKKASEDSQIQELKDYIKNLQNEELNLKEAIIAQNLVLINLKDERNKKVKEVEEQRIFLSGLNLETLNLQDKLQQLKLDHENQEKESSFRS
jgi:FHA domain